MLNARKPTPTKRPRLLRAAKLVALLTSILVAGMTAGCRQHDKTIRIFTARKIITMEPRQPETTAVAVRGNHIVMAGSLDELRKRLRGAPVTVDRRLENKVLLPGFVEPHLHPSLAATILPIEIVSAVEWWTPRGRTKAVRSHDAFIERLKELDREYTPGKWLIVWGYHQPYHGSLSRTDLDEISRERPIMVWQRSVHEMFFNTRALERLGLTEADFAENPQADWKTGHLWESAVFTLGRPMTRILAWPTTYWRGLSMMKQVIHRGGITTVGEQGFPQVSELAELLALKLAMLAPDVPYRFVLVPNAMYLLRREGSPVAAEEGARRMLSWSSDRIRIVRHMKYYADGAIYSQLMQMSKPYLDGHHGEWMMKPEDQVSVLDVFWRKGWNVHVHVNGDAGLDVVLDQIEKLMQEAPDPRRRVVLEHYGYARPDQHKRVARLGIAVSNNPYYVHELAPAYAEHGLGRERASHISPLGGLARAGVPFSFHSDYPMAPAEPLRLVWAAVTRIGSDGNIWGREERVSLDLALRAVTIEAARSLDIEQEVGSIRTGKKADFTVLEEDPYDVDPDRIKDIAVWGTVFEGRVYPAD